MSREAMRKLLGGYATDTLTSEERQALFAAALDDQELFDALAREQSLRDLLRDPAARARLLATLDDAPQTARSPILRWIWSHPAGLAAVACMLAVGIYTVRVAKFAPESAEETATARPAGNAKPPRVFQPAPAESKAPAPSLKVPQPPVVAQSTPALPLPQPPAPPIPEPPAAAVVSAPAVPAQAPAPVAPVPAAAGATPMLAGSSRAAGGGGTSREPLAGVGGATGGLHGAAAVPLARELATAPPPPVAAAGRAALTGAVVDASGAAVPGAQVEVRDLASGAVRQTVSGPEGAFAFNNLELSRYALTVRASGFRTLTENNVDLASAAPVDLGKMPMAIGALTEEVAVTAAATPVQTASSQNSKLVDTSQMADLTLKGRDLFAVLQTIPGVALGNSYLAAAAPDSIRAKFDPEVLALLTPGATGGAQPAPARPAIVSKGLALVRVTISGAAAPALPQLKAAGLAIKSHKADQVTGRIAVEKLLPLAQLPVVTWIAPGK
ncbi:MAG TPA: carboxypeptidase-like regulatory domain-containing protein [Bryobacteraceae bacterium]|nr:carboxypeptidase-like regulatory domain-containing protein [Bryobacteraceae bacterium]